LHHQFLPCLKTPGRDQNTELMSKSYYFE
jgi:hypothetical protein